MRSQNHGERIDRLEQIVEVIAEDPAALEKTVAELATHVRAGFDQVAEQFRLIGDKMAHTDERLSQLAERTDEQMRRTDERFRETDARIDRLVIAIGELIRRPV